MISGLPPLETRCIGFRRGTQHSDARKEVLMHRENKYPVNLIDLLAAMFLTELRSTAHRAGAARDGRRVTVRHGRQELRLK
jgi:hypothetical protein